ncbi:MAG: hypothetical protein JW741_03945 [Sedimentisphaerales bacterium]|nr:hypothetical protein [Sedimentisphaerales bacterium]
MAKKWLLLVVPVMWALLVHSSAFGQSGPDPQSPPLGGQGGMIGQIPGAGSGLTEQIVANAPIAGGLAAGTGVPEAFRAPLLNRESVAMAVGVLGQIKESLMAQVGVGTASSVPESIQIQAHLMNRESVGASVGVGAQNQAGLTPQNALTVATNTATAVQERLMNGESIGATIGIPVQMREHLQVGPNAP